MLSQIPTNLESVDPKDLDKEILRAAIIAELDATSLYEQMASMTKNEIIKKVLLDIAKEEKTHVGEFQALLLKEDSEQAKELAKGKAEVDELMEE
jgi:rubrerythrin